MCELTVQDTFNSHAAAAGSDDSDLDEVLHHFDVVLRGMAEVHSVAKARREQLCMPMRLVKLHLSLQKSGFSW